MTQTIVVRDDLDAVIAYEVSGEHVMHATAYHIVARARDAAGAYTVPEFPDRETDGTNPTPDLSAAEPLLTVMVKWDGCAHWNVGELLGGNAGYVHTCGRRDLANFAALLLAIFDLAAEVIPAFDKDTAA